MDLMETMRCRRSTRLFEQKQISEEELCAILKAADLAPVGSNLHADVHLTVVQDPKLLKELCNASYVRFGKTNPKELTREVKMPDTSKMPNLFYGAPTAIIVSHRRQTLQPGVEYANATIVAYQMHLAATSLGLGSCLIWGVLESMRMYPEYDNSELLQLPENFQPLLGVVVGYPQKPLELRDSQHSLNKNMLL